jgi:hypothetical protein
LVVGLSGVILAAGGAVAQAQSGYEPFKSFAPLALPEGVNAYRGGAGTPGPLYWQNRADYDLHARIDTTAKTLIGEETITYTNASPDTLDRLWIQLDQNTYRRDARSATANGQGRSRSKFTDGVVLDLVEVEVNGRFVKADYVVSDTRMQVRLATPLKPTDGKVRIHIRYHYTITGPWGGRTSWDQTPDGAIYDIAQWYPRMAVYDDVRGWDPLPYLANEFYLEYGTIDYAVTVPNDMIVAGSGELQNPQDVLTATQRQKLDQARRSDATVTIRSLDDVHAAQAKPATGERTWKFHMENTRDVAFSASNAFIWDAARINLPDGRQSLAMSVYPAKSVGPAAWGRSTEYLKHAVEEFSRRWSPYPYPVAVNVAGPSTGMEYPGLLFDGIDDAGKQLFWITAHEIGHTWFPMVVGFDERRNAWMDEGFNTFIDVYESDAFQKGVYGPKRDSEYAPGGGNPVEEIQSVLKDPDAPVIMTRADAIQEKYRHPVTYFKSALGLILLREQILGPDVFDPAFRKFIADWSFKHPKPSDFFRAMDSAGGEDLGWFWREWYFNNWNLDLAVQDVRYKDGDPAKGAQVQVANLDRMILPATLRIEFADGTKRDIRLPAETWIQKKVLSLAVDDGEAIASVTVDPDRVIPDKDRANNTFKVAAAPVARR